MLIKARQKEGHLWTQWNELGAKSASSIVGTEEKSTDWRLMVGSEGKVGAS